jgi:hypothetical protein
MLLHPVYDSFPGYCIVGLNIIQGAWFHYSMFMTFKSEVNAV